jgi:hypothetical protein
VNPEGTLPVHFSSTPGPIGLGVGVGGIGVDVLVGRGVLVRVGVIVNVGCAATVPHPAILTSKTNDRTIKTKQFFVISHLLVWKNIWI